MGNRWSGKHLVAVSMLALVASAGCRDSGEDAANVNPARGGSTGSRTGGAGGSQSGGSSGGGGSSSSSGGASGAGGSSGSGGTTASGGSGGTSAGSGGSGGAAGSGGASGGGSGGSSGVDAAANDAATTETGADGGAAGMYCMPTFWTAEASAICDNISCSSIPATAKDAMYAIDGDPATRYASGRAQGSMGPETLTIQFGGPVNISGVGITSQNGDGAATYKLEHSMDGTTFTAFTPPAEGTGSDDIMATFPATTMIALRITQTGMKTVPWWSVHEVTVVDCK
ncbi:MAG TPA: discoidin domain-containing protein [Polyangia bacterium]